MLVPGYINQEGAKALAKLSGLNPGDARYKRPESPKAQGGLGSHSALGMIKEVNGGMSVGGGTYSSTLGESYNNNAPRSNFNYNNQINN